MSEKPVILIAEPEKQLIEKDNFEIEINNYDNSHLYYKGFDLGTFKEIVNLRQEINNLEDNWNILKEFIDTLWLDNKGIVTKIKDKIELIEQGSDSNE
jgi:hypothetical protein|nr:MAG TPA: hypothetical protein [Caudoviricetes sp.]